MKSLALRLTALALVLGLVLGTSACKSKKYGCPTFSLETAAQ